MLNSLLVLDPTLDVWYAVVEYDESWYEDEEEDRHVRRGMVVRRP